MGNVVFFDLVVGYDNGLIGEFFGWVVINLFVLVGGMLVLVGVVVDFYCLWFVVDFFFDLVCVVEVFVIC